MSKHPDAFGDRMKEYEGREAKRKFLPTLPIVARIDGRTFSKFTRPFKRPFDTRLADAMRRTTAKLVEQTHARIGYTQSDEITLIFHADAYDSQIFFGGRVQKLTSVLASMTTAYFIRYLDENLMHEYRGRATAAEQQPTDYLMGYGVPHFDARVWSVPSKVEATNTLLWRAQDARKNGISSACRSMYSARSMDHKNQLEMVAMMREKGVDYYSAFSNEDRHGSFFQRRSYEVELDDATWAKIPSDQREAMGRTVTRSRVEALPIEYFGDYTNRVEIVFDAANPEKETL